MEEWRIYSRLKLSLALYQAPPWSLSAEQLTAFEPRFSRQQALEQRAVQYALGQGLCALESEINMAVDSFDRRLGDANVDARQMVKLGLDARGLYQAMAHEVVLDKVLQQMAQLAPAPDDAEVALWYQRHQAQFLRPEQREASHILLTVDQDQPDCQPEQVSKRITALHQRLCRDIGLFTSLAQRHSECPTALEGGKLGWISRGLLFAPLELALFALPAGGLSNVVGSPIGLHILLCGAIRPAAPIPEPQALATVRKQLAERMRKQFLRNWLNAL